MSARHRLLLPVAAVLLGLPACASTPSAAPAPAAPPVSAAPVSAAPVSPAAAPVSVTPPTTAPTTAKTTATTKARTKPSAPCPSAKALEKLADLPDGWRFIPSSVECWHGWATADPEGPNDGDGIYLFRRTSGGGWKYHSQGSGYHCAELGIRESAPFCQYP